MIFVTVGTTELPFNRLLNKMDELAPSLGEEVVMQTGASEFIGKNTRCQQYMNKEEISHYYDECTLLVCHAGVGTLLNGMSRNKPIVTVPRKTVFNEVDTDHQHMIAKELVEKGRGYSVDDIDCLFETIQKARSMYIPPYVKDTQLSDFMTELLDEIDSKLKN